jgi:hypothetical protein
MGQPVVILNTAQAAIDLLDKRSNIYSDRPDFHFFEELVVAFSQNSTTTVTNFLRSGWSDCLTFLSLGPKFRKHRKMLQNAFTPVNCGPYQSRQEELAQALAARLLEKPAEWDRHLVKYVISKWSLYRFLSRPMSKIEVL